MTSSQGHSEPLLELERDLVTSAEDVEALRRARAVSQERLLERVDELSAQRHFPHLEQRRTTSAGWEPFELG